VADAQMLTAKLMSNDYVWWAS